MSAVFYRTRILLRAQWHTTLGLSLVVASVGGLVLALAAGAARTSSAPDRYTTAQGGGFDGTVEQESRPRTPEVAALPAVSSVEAVTFVFGGLTQANGDAADAVVFAGSYRALDMGLVAGREPDPSRPDELIATRSFADSAGVGLGARFDLQTLSQEQADRGGFDAFASEGPRGPSSEVTLVGIVDGPSDLNDPTPFAVLAPSLLDRGAGVAITIMSVELRPDTTLADLRDQLDTLPGGEALSLEPAELVSSEVRTAVAGQARGFWLLTGVAGVAALVVVGQLITRTVRLSVEEAPRLEALGFDRFQVFAESAGRAGLAILAGAVMSVAVAASLSSVFPTGFVRRLEPRPGGHFDVAILAAGALGIVATLLVWTAASLLMGRKRRRGERPAELAEWVAVRSPSAALSTGVRFAFTRSRRDRGSVRATVLGLLATTAILVGSVVFDSSLARLVTDGVRFGMNWDLYAGSGGAIPDDLVARLASDDDIAAVMVYGTGQARIGPVTLGLAGMEPVKGDVAPTTLSGRLPSADDEIALGRLADKALGAEVGTELTIDTDGGARGYRVTGLAVVPSVNEIDGVGQDALVTMGGLGRADPDAAPGAVAVVLRPDAPADTGDRLGIGQSSAPIVINNLARVRSVPFLLAGLVGALAVLTVVHVTITSVHHRRRDLAVLRSLGADRRWISRAVHWQATSFSLVPLVLGVPLGLIAGRLVFAWLADSVGAVPSASFPYARLAGVLAAFVVLANAVAAVPASRARRLAPATVLATE